MENLRIKISSFVITMVGCISPMEKKLSFKIAMFGVAVLVASIMPSLAQTKPVQPVQPAPQALQAGVLSIDDAVAIAATNSPGLAIARERVLRSQNQVREAKSQGNFNVNTAATYIRVTPTSSITIPGPGGKPETIQTRPPTSTTGNATLSQPIDLSGQIRLGVGLAGLQLNIQQYGEAQTLQQLILDVKTAYYQVLRARANVDVAQSAVSLDEERLRIAQAQFDAGTAPKFDVTSAEVDLSNAKQALSQAQSAVQVNKAALSRTIGIDLNCPYDVQVPQIAVEPITVDIPESTRLALNNRPEVLQAKTGIAFAKKNVKFVATQDKPQLAAFISADYISGTTALSPNSAIYTYGARINWPIWTGGVTKARVAEARNDVNISSDNLCQVELNVEFDVRSSALVLMDASKRVASARANVALAEESIRLATVRYQEGVSTQVEVSNARDALTRAQLTYVGALYDYVTAQAQLQRAMAAQPEYSALTSSASAAITPQGVNK